MEHWLFLWIRQLKVHIFRAQNYRSLMNRTIFRIGNLQLVNESKLHETAGFNALFKQNYEFVYIADFDPWLRVNGTWQGALGHILNGRIRWIEIVPFLNLIDRRYFRKTLLHQVADLVYSLVTFPWSIHLFAEYNRHCQRCRLHFRGTNVCISVYKRIFYE